MFGSEQISLPFETDRRKAQTKLNAKREHYLLARAQ
jgi:hypothetical protein